MAFLDKITSFDTVTMVFLFLYKILGKYMKNLFKSLLILPLLFSFFVLGDEEETVEEVVVVGSQIKGASISGALPVTVLDFGDIEAIGADGGDELLESVAEQGLNFFNETENASGGVNSARGDMGAYNLRHMGVGNTLVLMNGRRLVNSPGYQTELLGGDYVPTVTVNSTLVPTYGLDRLEILRDGASAIYGSEAIAGVVNNVMQDDYEGFVMRIKRGFYDHFAADDVTISGKYGADFNGGATNVSIFFDIYNRDRIRAAEDPRWGNSDHRQWIPADSPWSGSTSFRNTSTNSLYGQFDMVSSSEHGGETYNHVWTDSNGEFEIFPLGDERCTNRGNPLFDTGFGTCIAPDGNGVERFNLWGGTDYRSDLERKNIFVFINHEMENGMESFTELGWYESDSNLTRHPSYAFSSSKHRVGPDNYWLNQLTVDVDGVATPIFAGKELYIDNYRYAEVPRIVDVHKTTYRFLQGFRGTRGDWDWETAFVRSKAKADDVTHNRVSNTLLKEALYDNTSAAYNPFSAGVDSNIERALVDVYRKGFSTLTMVDFKTTNSNLFELSSGPVGFLAGAEFRQEEIQDDRDPRLDGTIDYCDYENDCYPLVSDVLNSSPTGDVGGKRDVTSIFAELQIPLADNVDMQIALRSEDTSDADGSTVGKVALGWDVTDWMLLRGSFSTAFRAPNIVQINETIVVRSGSRHDYTIERVQQLLGLDDGDIDSYYTIQRQATGAENLEPEESDNTSFGLVLNPVDGLTITADKWSIDKEKTIGLFGRNNHTVLDMMLRFQAGTSDCANTVGNPAVVREAPDDGDLQYFADAGICPIGVIKYVADNYVNLADRTIEGYDIGVYYNVETDFGEFDVRYIGSHIDKFEQKPGGDFSALQAAQDSGEIPLSIPIDGFGDLLGQNGNYDNKHYARVSWKKGNWGATLSGIKKGEFYQSSLTLSDGTRYVIPEMTTYNLLVDYRFTTPRFDKSARIRFAVKNLDDERAPLADRYYGYFADAHQDLGRNYYIDLRINL